MSERIDGWSVTVEVNGEDILTIAHDCLGGHPDLVDEFAPYVRACAAHLISFIGAGPDHVGNHTALASTQEGQWISVDERLPDTKTWVLAHNGKWTGVATYEKDAEWIDERWRDERSEFVELLGPKVTHWMPLPCAPAAEA